jgi:hypothetical protein
MRFFLCLTGRNAGRGDAHSRRNESPAFEAAVEDFNSGGNHEKYSCIDVVSDLDVFDFIGIR